MTLPHVYRVRPEEDNLQDATRERNPEIRELVPSPEKTAVLLQQMDLKQAQGHTCY